MKLILCFKLNYLIKIMKKENYNFLFFKIKIFLDKNQYLNIMINYLKKRNILLKLSKIQVYLKNLLLNAEICYIIFKKIKEV